MPESAGRALARRDHIRQDAAKMCEKKKAGREESSASGAAALVPAGPACKSSRVLARSQYQGHHVLRARVCVYLCPLKRLAELAAVGEDNARPPRRRS